MSVVTVFFLAGRPRINKLEANSISARFSSFVRLVYRKVKGGKRINALGKDLQTEMKSRDISSQIIDPIKIGRFFFVDLKLKIGMLLIKENECILSVFFFF